MSTLDGSFGDSASLDKYLLQGSRKQNPHACAVIAFRFAYTTLRAKNLGGSIVEDGAERDSLLSGKLPLLPSDVCARLSDDFLIWVSQATSVPAIADSSSLLPSTGRQRGPSRNVPKSYRLWSLIRQVESHPEQDPASSMDDFSRTRTRIQSGPCFVKFSRV